MTITLGSTDLILVTDLDSNSVGAPSGATLAEMATGLGAYGTIVSTANAIGYATGAGGAVTQATSRTTGVTLSKATGAITLFSAAGDATNVTSFTVTNTLVAATDTVVISQKSGTDKYIIACTAVGAGTFQISFKTFSGTTTETPVFNFAVIKAVAA